MMLNFVVVTVLCLFNIAELKQTLLSSHILLLLAICLIIFLVINEFRKKKRSMCLVLIGIISVILTGIVGLICYYFDLKVNIFYILPIATLILISTFAADAMLIGLKMYARTIEADTLEYLAYNDIMTNLKNRGAFEKRLSQLQEKLSDGSKIGLAIIDINDLKQTNDAMGHQIGDELIIRCADTITECFNGIGSVYRIGGDEFCILTENVSSSVIKERAAELEEKLGVLSEQTGVVHAISIGYCVFDPKIDADLAALFKRADREMYKCKVRKNLHRRRSSDISPPK
jgi:diguanylate cyclase (GGDEF)-like protein